VGQIHKYSVKLYGELEAETGQHVGFSKVSNIRVARTKDRWDEFMYYAGIAETIGVKVNKLTPAQLKELWPLCEIDGIIGAIQHPDDGYIQPADLTQALAKGARNRGAEIYRNTTVTAIEQLPSGEWLVKTDKGDITCGTSIVAREPARKTARGSRYSVIPVEHQYIVTELHLIRSAAWDFPKWGSAEADSWYMREEMAGCSRAYEGRSCCYGRPRSKRMSHSKRSRPSGAHIETAIARPIHVVGIKKVTMAHRLRRMVR
jgi:dimethylglycine dehydrogenase